MKLVGYELVDLDIPKPERRTEPRAPGWSADAEVANPMSGYPKVKRHRNLWRPKWSRAWVKLTAEDGTWGLGPLSPREPCWPVVEQIAPHLMGEDCLATAKLADMMFRLTKPYGTTGLASYAISAVDLALWDLKGKLLDKPVYELLGGKQKDRIPCYATGNDVEWYQELGFRAFKLACPYGPADGYDGIQRNVELVAATRQLIGDDCELMLDCWMAFDVDYTVRLAEALRPCRLRWMEECLLSEDLDAHVALRERLPWQPLSTGEHWYTHVPFQLAASRRVVDILQPDIKWAGGMSTCLKISAIAEAAGLSVMLHGGGNTPYGQHYSISMPNVPMIECFVGTAPGVPLAEAWGLPGQALPEDGYLTPTDGPGFGLELLPEWIVPIS